MSKMNKPIIILVADDDPDDRLMIKESFEEARITNALHFVEDGEELIKYLNRQDKYQEFASLPLPGLILLDLNMPKKDGREALQEIKSDPNLHRIPVVIFTTSKAEEDIYHTYDLGVNSFISKPVTFESLVDTIKTVTKYWLEVVELPTK